LAILSINDTQHKQYCTIVLSVICVIVLMLNVIMLSVVAPLKKLSTDKHSSLLCSSFGNEEIKKGFRQIE